jgi:hypothetical protein
VFVAMPEGIALASTKWAKLDTGSISPGVENLHEVLLIDLTRYGFDSSGRSICVRLAMKWLKVQHSGMKNK